MADWSPFRSWQDFAYYVERVLQNAAETVKILLRFSALSGAIVRLFVLLLVGERGRRIGADRALYCLVTLLLFGLGYALVVTERRHLWFCCLVVLVMGGYGYDRLMEAADFFTPARRICLLAGIVLSFAFAPLFDLVRFRNMGARAYEHARALSEDICPGQRRASDGHWQDSVAIAYHLGARCQGGPRTTWRARRGWRRPGGVIRSTTFSFGIGMTQMASGWKVSSESSLLAAICRLSSSGGISPQPVRTMPAICPTAPTIRFQPLTTRSRTNCAVAAGSADAVLVPVRGRTVGAESAVSPGNPA